MRKSTGEILVREVALSDAPVWTALRGELWPDGVSEHGAEIAAFFRGTLPEPSAVLLSETIEGKIVGFAELSFRGDVPGLEGKRVGYVEGLYVIPEFRNKGVATKLLRASRSWATRQKCEAFASDRAGRFVIDRGFGQGNNQDRFLTY